MGRPVFGFEANYNYSSNLQASSTNSMTRLIVNPAGERIRRRGTPIPMSRR